MADIHRKRSWFSTLSHISGKVSFLGSGVISDVSQIDETQNDSANVLRWVLSFAGIPTIEIDNIQIGPNMRGRVTSMHPCPEFQQPAEYA